jgi:hypothetical protein
MSSPSDARLLRLLKTVTDMAELLPRLHEELIEAAGGVASVLLVLDTRSRELRPLAGHRVASLPLDPWLVSPTEAKAAKEALETGAPVVLSGLSQTARSLAESLGTDVAVIVAVPVSGGDPGVLVIGLPSAPHLSPLGDTLEPAVTAFGLALERARLEREVSLQRELRDLLQGFARTATAKLDVAAGLSVICKGAVRLFGADRASVWLHDRRTRELVCRGTSEPRHTRGDTRVSVEDALSIAATALRRPTAEIVMSRADRTGLSVPIGIAIPLRGRRRALGSLVIDGVRVEPGAASGVLARADELGRQLSIALENAQLLEDVVATRRGDAEGEKE